MKTYLIIGALALIVVGVFVYLHIQNNNAKEQLAAQLLTHQQNANEQNKGSLLDFASAVIPSLFQQYNLMKDNKKEKEIEKKAEVENTGNYAPFVGPLVTPPSPFVK